MFVDFGRFSCYEDVFGLGNFSGSPMGYEKIAHHLFLGMIVFADDR